MSSDDRQLIISNLCFAVSQLVFTDPTCMTMFYRNVLHCYAISVLQETKCKPERFKLVSVQHQHVSSPTPVLCWSQHGIMQKSWLVRGKLWQKETILAKIA